MALTKRMVDILKAIVDEFVSTAEPVGSKTLVDKYGLPYSSATIRRFMSMDVLIQCNAEFFLSWRTAGKAIRMLREERIHFLGSDAHNLSSRAPNLGAALALIERKLGPRALDRLLDYERLIG